MADQLKKIKTRGYSISKVNFIRQALAGYGGDTAIASEMIQNADDAQASLISFHFTEQALIVRNDSVFTEKDFDSITEIAKGEKAPETGKIGTWGTGFLSVFHITDAPELRSSGEYIVFDPTINDLPVYKTDIIDSTEFRLPWRTKPTLLSERLEADTWSTERILELKNKLISDMYRLVLFLRHVSIIEVYDGETESKPIARVERKPSKKYTNNKFTRLQCEVEYKRAGLQPRTDTWLYYLGQVPTELRPAGITIKDSGLAIAFPLKKLEWLDQNVPPVLYNFLPTPINTGLPFQINGAFFPDNNRQNILLNLTTQREKSVWNWQVLHQLGQLFVSAVLDMREQVKDVYRFYQLLPIVDPRRSFLEPVQKCFLETAAILPIVFTSLNDWRKPSEVFIGRRGSRLPELAAEYLPVLPTGVTQEFRDFLEQKQNVQTLEIKHILNYLRPELSAGRKLSAAHPIINNREKLEILYGELPAIPSLTIPGLANYALGLAEDETLWPFVQMWRASKSTRQLLAGTDIRFIDIEMQEKFASRMDKLIDEFRGASLVAWLTNQSWPKTSFKLANAPNFIKDEAHLAKWLRFISADRNQVDRAMLAKLPLIRTVNDQLVYPAETIFRCDDTDDRAMLQDLGLKFIHQEWATDNDIWMVYHLAGVKMLHPQYVIAALLTTLDQWRKQPIDEVIDQLGRLFSYFYRHLRTLTEQDRQKLRQLPLCVTQQGRLVPADGGAITLHLSTDASHRSNRQTLAHLDQLKLDNLIHSKLLERGRKFLTDILGLETLSPARLIETVIIPYYNDLRLSDTARQDLLRFISEEMRNLAENQQRQLFPLLLNRSFIRCADGRYRLAKEVYFASPALDTVFVNGYHTLHPDYGVEVAAPEDQEQTPYRRSTWYWLFDLLGVNETPTSTDLIRAVQTVVTAGPPTAQRLEAVRRIYDLLNREAGKGEFTIDGELKRLATLAWLPARNDDIHWYKPDQLYQASHADFVGDQAPLLRFPESTTQLRRLLEMPTFPSADIIASHLLASACKNNKVDRRVYDDIGRRWKELSYPLQQRLKNEAVVWGDGDKYWPTNRVFLGDYHRGLFGQRRCYLKPPGGDAQEFLQQIGVKEKPDDWYDSIALLLEISGDYADNQPVSEHDLILLYRNFDHLGRQMLTGPGRLHATLHQLKKCKLVPAKDGCLHPANHIVLADRRDILDQFDPDTIPVVPEDGMTENAYHFLRELGVSRLSLLIHRRPVDTSGREENIVFSLTLQQLIPAFQRMALTYHEQNGTTSQLDLPAERLRGVKLRVCQKLVVGYKLDNREGWRVEGHSRPEEALYYTDDKDLNFLYVKQTKPTQFPYVALARELERILFPNSKESPVIEQLLRKPAEVDGYLDEHGYRRLYQDEISGDNFEVEQPGLTEWEKAPETSPSDDIEFEDEQEDTLYPEDISGDEDQPDVDKDIPIDDVKPTSTSQQEFDFEATGEVDDEQEPNKPDESLQGLARKADTPTTVQTTDTTNTDETIPPFTGIRRPAVPVLPNDYGELQRKFGLERITNGVGDSDSVEADHDWCDPSESDPKDGIPRVRQSRFTLTFTNRYQGFLPLHSGARQMLPDQPTQLNCQTDFEEWTFPLYVNYKEGILYNQKMLSKFFEAYNIPAGGIIYLERVSQDTVRLFWKPMSSRVEHIRCLELLEDGTLAEYEVPAAEFPCEVAEYVLRAEKRLEDPEALFKQALNKRGAFQTICEVFGEADRELTYDEIFKGVMERRQVAKTTIDYQLSRRPCFVDLNDGRWRFEPKRGTEPEQPHPKTLKTPASTSADNQTDGSNSQRAPTSEELGLDEPLVHQPASPYHRLLADIRQEWQELSEILQPNGNDPRAQLQQLGQELVTLGQRIQENLAALAETQIETDDLLVRLWVQISRKPGQPRMQQDLARYLLERLTANPKIIAQVKRELVQTPSNLRRQIFLPLLSRVAEKTVEKGEVTTARGLYLLLQQQGGGTFETQLTQLAQHEDIQIFIERAQSIGDLKETWSVWEEAWQKYLGFPTLRQAIQTDLTKTVTVVEQEISEKLGRQHLSQARQQYIDLLEIILPVLEAWQADPKTSVRIGKLARQLFEAFIELAQSKDDLAAYQQALQIIKLIPPSVPLSLSGNLYLEAVLSVAQHLESQPGVDDFIAAALLEYGLFWIRHRQCAADQYTLSRVYENVARLLENVGFLNRAHSHALQAQKQATGDRKVKLGKISYGLNQKSNNTNKKAELENWRGQMTALLTNGSLIELVDTELFQKMVANT